MKLFRYSGAKDKYLSQINDLINQSINQSIYIEPFLGSGAVFLNLEKEFDEYIISDIDPNITRIFNSVKESEYLEFFNFYNVVMSKFGDIKKDKESYYKFRNSFNEKLWKTDTKKEGFGLLMLYSSCINSLARFGPNGFNQSYGNRLYVPDETTWNSIKSKLEKTTILNLDFISLMNEIGNKVDKSLMFLDPPYFYGGKVGYDNLEKSYYVNYLNFIENTKSNIVYTDIKHDDLSSEWKCDSIRTMRNISPNRTSELTKEEVIYYNF